MNTTNEYVDGSEMGRGLSAPKRAAGAVVLALLALTLLLSFKTPAASPTVLAASGQIAAASTSMK